MKGGAGPLVEVAFDEAAGLLNYAFAVVEELLLALDLDLDSLCDSLEGVEVLELRSGAELLGALGGDGDVDVAADRALLHLAVANSCVLEKQHYLFKVSHDLVGGVEIRLGDYLNERHAAAVVVRKGNAVHFIVDELACVLFKMDTIYAYLLFLALYVYLYLSGETHRARHLGYLVCLGQVGIEIVFSVPFCEARYIAVHHITRLDDVLNGSSVQHRESSGKSAAHRAAAGVRGTAEFSGAGAEHLGIGGKLCVCFKSYRGKISAHSGTSLKLRRSRRKGLFECVGAL